MPVSCNTFGNYKLYTIRNSVGAYVSITDLGATIQSLAVPGRNGKLIDVVLGYDTPGEYLHNSDYFGAFVGRYANRISNASFILNGREYKLTANEGKNTLHGGNGLSKRRFDILSATGNRLVFSINDPDGSDGFPGNLNISVAYEFNDNNELSIYYEAESDADTYLSLTNHSYFNLAGRGNILSHKLEINADKYLPVDASLIPTGDICPVAGTEFDFRSMRTVGSGFYDHCYILSSKDMCTKLYSEESGIGMTVISDMPAVQFYAGGGIKSQSGKRGKSYEKNSALCLETQNYPDAPNSPNFPAPLLRAGKKFISKTSFVFSVN